ncbi:HdeD family acid-resistance protein [Bradyrhizobium sp. LHD-71]|uniref:HdeD family acid-resistance protein n=1 Tax=Bradyrhizobium sp. LHD-71 TaxID=3072141 RepID=UPI00280E4296|nr:HdeD family acid-resistance protein [Bradyrhizobium sp. LHD-71]MDQ8731514.1 HdeD family acid-resistance protein [Bradyrhizobium sp. LHD-71]
MTDQQTAPGAAPDLRSIVTKHWKMFLAEGILLALLGIGAIIVPPIAGLAVTVLLGWLFLIGGIFGLIATYWGREMPGFWWSLFSAGLMVLAGLVLVARPMEGLLTLTVVLTAFFVLEGVASIMFALDHKRELSGRWGWMVAAGVFDLVIAALIFAGLPGSALWAIGLLVGINMLFGGSSLIAMALAAKPK